MTTLKPLRRRAAAVSAPLLLALSLTACGGGASGAPDDASVEDFCGVQESAGEANADIDTDDDGAVLDALKESADQLSEVGTPADFSDDARAGFEIYIDFVEGADESDLDSDDEDIFDEEEIDQVNAFFEEAATACQPDLGELEEELGDLESELPE